MITLDSALDAAMNLSFNKRVALVEILNKRIVQERRNEMANEIREASELYQASKFEHLTADQIISKLHLHL